MTDGRILCFGSAATAAEFFALEKKHVQGSENKEQGLERKKEEESKEPKRKSVFERLGEPFSGRKLTNRSNSGKKPSSRTSKPHRQNKHRKGFVQVPEWNNHSLIGDSIMVRIGKALNVQLLNSPACRGGLTTSTLINIIRAMDSTPKNIIMLIGVNDVIQGVSKDAIVENFHQILTMMRLKGTEQLVLIELLPVVNLRSPQIMKKLQDVNQCISQMEGGIVKVLKIFKNFMKNTKKGEEPNCNLFERKKSDHMVLHPGTPGIQLIINKLKTLLDL